MKIKEILCWHKWIRIDKEGYISVVRPLIPTSFWSPSIAVKKVCSKCKKVKEFYY